MQRVKIRFLGRYIFSLDNMVLIMAYSGTIHIVKFMLLKRWFIIFYVKFSFF